MIGAGSEMVIYTVPKAVPQWLLLLLWSNDLDATHGG